MKAFWTALVTMWKDPEPKAGKLTWEQCARIAMLIGTTTQQVWETQ